MAKLNRERGLMERRAAKEARKAARKLAAARGEEYPPRAPEDDASGVDGRMEDQS